jgi:hypothetical protein
VKINGAAIREIYDAVEYGLTKTAADSVIAAKRRPRMPVRTGTLQSSIQMRKPRREGRRISVQWGSFDVRYALYQELGFRSRAGRFIPGRGFLRGAAAEEYPKLGDHIRRRLG